MNPRVGVTKAAINKGYGMMHPELIGDTPYWFPPISKPRRKRASSSSGGKKCGRKKCRGGSYTSASLDGGSYTSASLDGGAYNDSALYGGEEVIEPAKAFALAQALQDTKGNLSDAFNGALSQLFQNLNSQITPENIFNAGQQGFNFLTKLIGDRRRAAQEVKNKEAQSLQDAQQKAQMKILLAYLKKHNPEKYKIIAKKLKAAKEKKMDALMEKLLSSGV